jgi:hypothetical protein
MSTTKLQIHFRNKKTLPTTKGLPYLQTSFNNCKKSKLHISAEVLEQIADYFHTYTDSNSSTKIQKRFLQKLFNIYKNTS